MKVLLIFAVVLYATLNLITAKLYSAREMKHDFIDGQCIVGKVFANVFYLPAWVLKGLRYVIVTVIK